MKSAFLVLFPFFALTWHCQAWQNAPNCGIKGNGGSLTSRICHGQDALPHEFPWAIYIRVNGQYICGGSIISDNWIVTAGHCITGVDDASQFTVVSGAHNRSDRNEHTVVSNVSKYILHPDYLKPLNDNDIGLLKLSQPLHLNSHIAPVCLPEAAEELDKHAGQNATAIGWGMTGAVEDLATVLQKVNLTLKTFEACRREWPTGERSICADGRGVSAVCSGDSGSALNFYQHGRWYLYGVDSAGGDCTVPDKFEIYTRITQLMPWIESTIAGN